MNIRKNPLVLNRKNLHTQIKVLHIIKSRESEKIEHGQVLKYCLKHVNKYTDEKLKNLREKNPSFIPHYYYKYNSYIKYYLNNILAHQKMLYDYQMDLKDICTYFKDLNEYETNRDYIIFRYLQIKNKMKLYFNRQSEYIYNGNWLKPQYDNYVKRLALRY